MNITSYNITDVAYHYIGLRVLAALPTASREEQFEMISRNVLKYASDKALRLMLPEPRGVFETVGEKVCQELKHFDFADPAHGKGYQLTEAGQITLALLNAKKYAPLRRLMAETHLTSYDNLRALVRHYLEVGPILSPTVEAARASDQDYIRRLLLPTFHAATDRVVESLSTQLKSLTPKKVEDAIREKILVHHIPTPRIGVPLFRSMNDRLISLRLVNIMKTSIDGCEFAKSYTPCVKGSPLRPWYTRLDVPSPSGPLAIQMSEPDMSRTDVQAEFLEALDAAFSALKNEGGYYDLPEVRDFTCQHLMIPEASFDEGVNCLLDAPVSPLTMGLQYDRISGRRKPLVRTRESVQIYNLIRRA